MTTIEPKDDLAARELERVLHHDIPLTRDMGMRVIDLAQAHAAACICRWPPTSITRARCLAGSLYCGAVLAGWGWLHLRLHEVGITDGHIVIQDGQISYPLPVRSDAIARCEAPEMVQWEKFITTYQRRGRARLTLHTCITAQDSDEQAVRFVGQFVLHR
ncbi:thioesterase [Pseudomonas syringae pv. actinidifoliorum]|nr:thioesterase [Pseudomonas syringae pv. actinidifoliorum]